jgi:hypothetical protein
MKNKEDNTWKYGSMKLSTMTYTFVCDNQKCNKTIICLFSKYDEQEYFGRCNYCQSGRLKWAKNICLKGVLKDQNIIYIKKRRKK